LVSLSGANIRTGRANPNVNVLSGQCEFIAITLFPFFFFLIRFETVFTWFCDDAHRDVVTDGKIGFIDCAALGSHVNAGDVLLVDDGLVTFDVLDASPQRLLCVVRTFGSIRSHKRVVAQRADGSTIHIESLEKAARESDLADAKWAAEFGVDFIDGDVDAALLHSIVAPHGVQVLARIVDDAALRAALLSDGKEEHIAGSVLLRHQLGASCAISAVPSEQRSMVAHSVYINRPVLISAHMLESMARNPRPSRSEVSDVINAVMEGVHGLVLTTETATGRDPVAAVRQLHAICLEAESSIDYRYEYVQQRRHVKVPLLDPNKSMASNAALCARDINCQFMMLNEPNEALSKAVAQFRGCAVAHFSSSRRLANQAMLLRGRVSVLVDNAAKRGTRDRLDLLMSIGFLKRGELILVMDSETMEIFAAGNQD
jgi:pyruvate kinase